MQQSAANQAVFLQQWQTYRKIIANNYMFHREVYDLLHRMLIADARSRFSFVDIACGDASATASALNGTAVGHYLGIDLSRPALDLAEAELAALGCPVVLQQADFVDAMARWEQPIDVAWIGQSLHHLPGVTKLPLLKIIRSLMRDGGFLVVWEPTTREGEDRAGWLDRFQTGTRPFWTEMTTDECDAMVDHMRAGDFPESAARWESFGLEAGFKSSDCVFVAPRDLSRMYRYRV